jgi:hypothetical protein
MAVRVVAVVLAALASPLVLGAARATAASLPDAPAFAWTVADAAAPPVTAAELAALPRVEPAGWAEPAAGSDVQQPTAAAPQPQPAPMPRAVAYEYSDAYRTRAKIHRYASFATLPLFVSQLLVGNKLYDGDTGKKGAHSALAFGIGTLFGVNSVTGVWNLWEGRKDPVHRTRRLVHGIVMLGCDAGFVATGLLAPDDDHGFDPSRRSLHRKVAITSMGIAGANFLFMLLTNR